MMTATRNDLGFLQVLVLVVWTGLASTGAGEESRFSYSCPLSSHCGNTFRFSADNRTPIYILVLVPFPDDRRHAGWDYGMQMLPGGRIARDFVNCNRSDLLPGYRLQLIESNHEACGITRIVEDVYLNLARFGLHQECGPVLAVAGLTCSPSTVRVSELAGRADLIQLSSSASPIFDKGMYRRLWRYVSTATVYADTVIAVMKALDWRNVGLIQDLDSEYYFNIGEYFKKAVAQNNFKLQLSFGVESTNNRLLYSAIQTIKDSRARIIFASTTFAQSTLLICKAATEGLITPHYLWIFPDMYIADFEEQISVVGCDLPTLYRGLNRTLLFQYDLINAVNVVSVGGHVFHNYTGLYMKYLQDVRRDFNYSGDLTAPVGVTYSHILFDQIWSFVNALNQSMSQLQSSNISIGINTVGNTAFADILEDRLSHLNLPGITGNISFNMKVTSTPIRIVYPITVNETKITNTTVGCYHNNFLRQFNLTKDNVPNDIENPTTVILQIWIILLLYLSIFMVTILTTAVLTLFCFYRNKPEVKAASPYLSMFMFAGCYLLCLAALLRITYGGFGGVSIFGTLFEFLCGFELFVAQNGYTLIFVTLFIKLLRVHHIFNNKQLQYLSNFWKNSSLAVVVVALCSIPNILSAVIIVIRAPNYTNSSFLISGMRDENDVRIDFQVISCNIQNNLLYIIPYFPLIFYLVFIIYLAVTMRRIRNKNFKDTKKVNIFVVVSSLLMVVYIATWWLLLVNNIKQFIVLVQTLFPLTVAMACVVILLAPKVMPVCWTEAPGREAIARVRKASVTTTITTESNTRGQAVTGFSNPFTTI